MNPLQVCIQCLKNNSAGMAYESDSCSMILGSQQFNTYSVCEPCSDVVRLVNTIVIATSVVGGVSFIGTLCVIVVIVA